MGNQHAVEGLKRGAESACFQKPRARPSIPGPSREFVRRSVASLSLLSPISISSQRFFFSSWHVSSHPPTWEPHVSGSWLRVSSFKGTSAKFHGHLDLSIAEEDIDLPGTRGTLPQVPRHRGHSLFIGGVPNSSAKVV